MYSNLANSNIDFFNFTRELFSEYSILKMTNELEETFKNLSYKYGFTEIISLNVRETYNYLITKYYPNEATVKSKFLNSFLFNLKNSVTFFEFKLDNSRADLCCIRDKSIAFEIKTDLDNFIRLKKQIYDYSEVFEEVYIICSKENIINARKLLPEYCGIYTYSIHNNSIYKFKREKKATFSSNLNIKKQLNLLNLKELKLSFKKYKDIDSKQQIIDLICGNYSSKFINSKFKTVLKHRYELKWQFIKTNQNQIFDLDYQWFFKNNISPKIVYQ